MIIFIIYGIILFVIVFIVFKTNQQVALYFQFVFVS